jgi:hypothetical protein
VFSPDWSTGKSTGATTGGRTLTGGTAELYLTEGGVTDFDMPKETM